ncbi:MULTISPECIES: HAMP domain-containing sensor histidine kinase [unclassified Paenibacillus]|uniref:sensor histidine kinase n=1 Tax=unclassified Paenibacillus TaxID=185978 RepID=UPI0009541381|nr:MULTISPECIES: HAMP domain-containing sensor histidine kinase [unclassified Paenibacillus]ASS65632.1 HAMP domain-containing histidine kinase [Paenibacillus sp. RUD330]SIQ29077.1 Signal transduction histidine kinase [Paenibacillus sp. RU4X]SIQ51199.1 Signal transduction histidine kinase [Paenibacillus sp. RU4T]
MSIRFKLMLSYIAMAAVPLVLMTAVMSFMLYMMGYQDLRDFFEKNRDKEYGQAVQFGELWYVLHHDSGKLTDDAYLKQIDGRMNEVRSGFVLQKDGAVAYSSSLALDSGQPEKLLLQNGDKRDPLTIGSYSYEVFHAAFTYPDGTPGKAAMFRLSEAIPVYWRPLITMLLLLAVGLMSALMALVVSRSITRPLSRLKNAALSLKEGNLEPVPLPAGNNEIGQVGTAFEEMRSRLKLTIEQMQQYEENRKMLLSHISHDLKTPITAVRGYVEGLLDGVADTPEKQERYLRTVFRKAKDMDRLIDELFLYSKLDLHKEEFLFRRIDFKAFLRHYLEEKSFELEKSGILLSAHIGGEHSPMHAMADPEKLGRALDNMLDNSAKYMSLASSDERKVVLRLEAAAEAADIIIEDTGPGIDEEALPFVFDRFYRAEMSRNPETGGSGLGLAIVRQIAEGHGGAVTARNRAEGGAAFMMRLPLESAGPKEAKQP